MRSPGRLVAFTSAADGGWATWSYAALARWQRLPASGGLYEVAGASDVRPFRSARGSGESPEEVRVSLVSHNYFDASGARVVLGRPFAGRDAAGPGTGASRLSATASGAGGSAGGRRAGEDHRAARRSVRHYRRRRVRIHRALRRLSRGRVGPADDAAGAAAGDAWPGEEGRGNGGAMAEGRRPARPECQD